MGNYEFVNQLKNFLNFNCMNILSVYLKQDNASVFYVEKSHREKLSEEVIDFSLTI